MAEKLKCNLCDQEATVHLTQIVNNKIHKVDLCESCAQKKGVTDAEGFSLADLLTKSNATLGAPSESQAVCPNCGYKTSDFRRTGRLGCSHCFDTFRDILLPVLEDMHPGTTHKGKIPCFSLNRRSLEIELKDLRGSLEKAVAEEAYEDAAKFRDQIKLLEANSKSEPVSR